MSAPELNPCAQKRDICSIHCAEHCFFPEGSSKSEDVADILLEY